jgi:opacity protein-like surface antigen
MRKILVAAAGAFVLSIAANAAAQTTKPVGLSIRAGVDFPTSSNRGGNNTLFGAGLEFKLQNINAAGIGAPNSNAHLSISADYYGKDSAYNLPVLLNYVGTNNEFFYSVGAGVSFSKGGNNNGNNETGFGYQAGIGYNFAQSQTPLFMEAKYFGNSNSRLNAIGVYLGIRL